MAEEKLTVEDLRQRVIDDPDEIQSDMTLCILAAMRALGCDEVMSVCSEDEDCGGPQMEKLDEIMADSDTEKILYIKTTSQAFAECEETMFYCRNGKKVVSMVTRDTGGTVYTYFYLPDDS